MKKNRKFFACHRLISVLLLAFMLVSAMCMTAFADTVDSSYSYYMSSSSGYKETKHRGKDTTSKVFVHPTNAPNAWTAVQTWAYARKNGNTYVMGSEANFTDLTTVYLKSGSYYAITNYVYESGYHNSAETAPMWLKFRPAGGTGIVSGEWSPDWTGNTWYGNQEIIIK